MRDFQKKRGWRNILQSWPVLAILAIFLVVFLAGVVNFMGKMLVTIENRKIVENKITPVAFHKHICFLCQRSYEEVETVKCQYVHDHPSGNVLSAKTTSPLASQSLYCDRSLLSS